MVEVVRVFNNNVVSSRDSHEKEVIVLGRGIGFQKKTGDTIDKSRVEKVFVLSEPTVVSRLEQLFRDIPAKFLEITTEIVDYAGTRHGLRLKENIYLSLTDHIGVAVERMKDGVFVTNAMLSDIKSFYKKEYEIGVRALEVIERETGVALPDDEAGFIALHILNASPSPATTSNIDAVRMARVMQVTVKDFYDLDVDTESLPWLRFASQVNHLAKRLVTQPVEAATDEVLYTTARRIFPTEYECSELVRKKIFADFGIAIPQEELGLLIVNIGALLRRS